MKYAVHTVIVIAIAGVIAAFIAGIAPLLTDIPWDLLGEIVGVLFIGGLLLFLVLLVFSICFINE